MGDPSFTIGELCRRSGLSRSALLYYDSIGILSPSGRAGNNYRLYTEEDAKRLAKVCEYRDAGVSLEDIKRLLGTGDDPSRPGARKDALVERDLLNRRLSELNDEMRRLKARQRLTIRLLSGGTEGGKGGDRLTFSAVLRGAGYSEEQMRALHEEFEALAPDEHGRFLRFIGMGESDIRKVRAKARKGRSK